MRLYKKGKERIEDELDIVKLMKDLRHMKILLKNSLMSKKMQFDIIHAEKNIIDVSVDSSEDDSFNEQLEIIQSQITGNKGGNGDTLSIDGRRSKRQSFFDKATFDPDQIVQKLRHNKKQMPAKVVALQNAKKKKKAKT